MAASYRISAVEEFNFAKPDEWPRWIRRFERFKQASGLSDKKEEVQVSTLVYSLGDQAEDILLSFKLSDEELKKYGTVKGKFENYFVKRRNVVYERTKLNRRSQRENETVDEYITDLYHLAEHCGYGTLHDELPRDRILVGIKDYELSEKLQLESDLTLDSCITQAQQSEAVNSQQHVIRGDRKDKILVDAVKSHRRGPPTKKPTGSGPRQTSCSRCGRSPLHGRQQCPSNQAICHKCHKKGHFKHCCRSKGGLREVKQNTDSDDSEKEFLGAVSADAVNTTKPWTITLKLNGRNVEFKVDTGADVTVIPESIYNPEEDGELECTGIPLNGPTGEKLDVCGRFTGHLESKDQK